MASQPKPETPAIAVWALRVGGGISVACGGLLSFVALYRLALENGWPPYAAWGLPVCADTLAVTAFIVVMAVSRSHPASNVAHFCAGIALLITVGCNVEYHALLPATHWGIGHVMLVTTGATPALVVELVIVMQMYLGDGATLVAQETATATKGATRRDKATRPVVAPVPGAPVARPVASATPAVAPVVATAAVAVAPRKPATATKTPVAVNDVVLALIAEHGVDNVTGPMVGDALGKHRGTGARHLDRVKKDLKSGKLTLPRADDETEAERELMEFLEAAR